MWLNWVDYKTCRILYIKKIFYSSKASCLGASFYFHAKRNSTAYNGTQEIEIMSPTSAKRLPWIIIYIVAPYYLSYQLQMFKVFADLCEAAAEYQWFYGSLFFVKNWNELIRLKLKQSSNTGGTNIWQRLKMSRIHDHLGLLPQKRCKCIKDLNYEA